MKNVALVLVVVVLAAGAGYAGSLLSQHHGESTSKHGPSVRTSSPSPSPVPLTTAAKWRALMQKDGITDPIIIDATDASVDSHAKAACGYARTITQQGWPWNGKSGWKDMIVGSMAHGFDTGKTTATHIVDAFITVYCPSAIAPSSSTANASQQADCTKHVAIGMDAGMTYWTCQAVKATIISESTNAVTVRLTNDLTQPAAFEVSIDANTSHMDQEVVAPGTSKDFEYQYPGICDVGVMWNHRLISQPGGC